jgi:hypothetical protein
MQAIANQTSTELPYCSGFYPQRWLVIFVLSGFHAGHPGAEEK